MGNVGGLVVSWRGDGGGQEDRWVVVDGRDGEDDCSKYVGLS